MPIGSSRSASIYTKVPIGQVTTAVDASGNTQTTKRRTQKSYEDILGPTYKTEVWDLDGIGIGSNGTPYSTTNVMFNGRDQILSSVITDSSSTLNPQPHQDTTATYDGHGRLATKHIPQQNTSTSTAYSYNADDSISTVTDARGAMTTYTYGNPSATEKRAVVTGVSWSAPVNSGRA